jgi:hypothetical protein
VLNANIGSWLPERAFTQPDAFAAKNHHFKQVLADGTQSPGAVASPAAIALDQRGREVVGNLLNPFGL